MESTKGVKLEKTLYVIRGIAGSGKSTYAKTISPNHFEADMFWELLDGTYRFDMDKLSYAHKWCQAKVSEAMFRNEKKIVVSNTFTTLSEIEPYIQMAKQFEYKVKIINMRTQYKSVHNVPEDVLNKMKKRWQEIPEEWTISFITVEDKK